MKKGHKSDDLVVGLDVPAHVGMHLDDVMTPALIIDLDAFEHNIETLRKQVVDANVRLRAHSKTHKSVDIARYQIDHGGACGICCQKLSEAEVMVAGGIDDVMISNQLTDPVKIERLAKLAQRARLLICVDDSDNIRDLSKAATRHGASIECLVEIDCGARRCGVAPGQAAVALAQQIAVSDGLQFAGLQAYQGNAQHIRDYAARKQAIATAILHTGETVDALATVGLHCDIIAGAGTGSYHFEAASNLYNELQCGSYIFMDADYQRVLDQSGKPVSEFQNSLFIWTGIMSKVQPDMAICDAGFMVLSVYSVLPRVFANDDIEYVDCSDEHGSIADPHDRLRLNNKIRLVPGHCDPTCNLHDWYVGLRDEKVECMWPVSARGKAF
jgi:3-hydroxy-D-aspartate aldolase